MRASVFLFLASVVTAVAQAPVGPHGEPAKAIAIHAPKPNYPKSLKKRGIGGRGDFDMHVDVKSGQVTSVDVVKSTGVRALDGSCVHAFQQWRFVPNKAAPIIHCPVRFDPHIP
jgi:TonB family protein